MRWISHGPRAAWLGDTVDRVPIGWALPHVREELTHDGELLIGGPGLALGYRDQPEMTKLRFRGLAGSYLGHDNHHEDPAGSAGARYFYTGDRVSRCRDGMLVHLGRLDNEVKVRGIRVDPADVEAEIANHSQVAAVAVAGTPVGDHTALVAYVVARSQAHASTLATTLRRFLRDRVPGHLVPSRITVVPELYYTASGKVDRMTSHRRLAGLDLAKESVDGR